MFIPLPLAACRRLSGINTQSVIPLLSSKAPTPAKAGELTPGGVP